MPVKCTCADDPNCGAYRHVRADGYVQVWMPDHPLARRDGYVQEHRMVAWDAGLLTDPALQVHHKNGVKGDNRPENLVVMSVADHALHHAEEAGQVTNQYGTFPVKPWNQRASAMVRTRPLRTCEHCETSFSVECRRDARFCSARCRVTAWKHAHL